MLRRTRSFLTHSWPMAMLPEVSACEREVEAALAAVKAGRDLWSVMLKYGLKHKPGCSHPEDPGPCDCGLVEEVATIMQTIRTPLGGD